MSCEFVCLRFEGTNAEKALNGQCSQDVRDLGSTSSKLIAFCNPKGRMFGSGRLIRNDSLWLLITPASHAETICKRLRPFMELARVSMQIDDRPVALTREPLNLGSTHFESVIRVGEHGGTSWLIGGSENDLDAHTLRLEAGLHFVTPRTDGQLLPQQAHYQMLGGVSFTKGCYTGQEVISRLEHLGQTKQWLWIHRGKIEHSTEQIILNDGQKVKHIESVTLGESCTALVLASCDSKSTQLVHVPFDITRQVAGQRPVKLG